MGINNNYNYIYAHENKNMKYKIQPALWWRSYPREVRCSISKDKVEVQPAIDHIEYDGFWLVHRGGKSGGY